VFARLDANQDGFLTREELREARPERNPEAMDADKDGKISREEWKGQPEVFNRIDANQDGFITADERPNLPRGQRGPRGQRTPPANQ
jgi:Ca2+-binding EF-hand superfamily protein